MLNLIYKQITKKFYKIGLKMHIISSNEKEIILPQETILRPENSAMEI